MSVKNATPELSRRPGTRQWAQAALASLNRSQKPDDYKLPDGFEALSVDRSFRLLEQGRTDQKIMGVRAYLRANNPWDDRIQRLIESARPRHVPPLQAGQAERLHRILTSDDLLVPSEPREDWANLVNDSLRFLSSLSLHSSVELLTSSFTATPVAMAASATSCVLTQFSFATLRPLEDLRHIVDPQRWDDCSPLFVDTHVLTSPAPPSGTSWPTRYDLYEEVALTFPGSFLPVSLSISNLLDTNYEYTEGVHARTDFLLRESYENVLDVDRGFFEARAFTVFPGLPSLQLIEGEKCLHFTSEPLNALASVFIGPLLTAGAIQMVATCQP